MLEILLLAGLVVFVTHSIESITGFGCTVLALPFVIFLMKDLEQAKILLSILAWILAVYFVAAKFKSINWKQFGIILLLAGLGMPIGMWVFMNLDAVILIKLLGIFIVLSAAIQLYKCFFGIRLINTQPSQNHTDSHGSKKISFHLHNQCYSDANRLVKQLHKVSGYFFLFAGGIVHGAFAAGGPLVVLYSAGKIPDKAQFRATMCLLWTTLNTALMIRFMLEKKLNLEVGRNLLVLLPFLVAGIIAGDAIHKKVNETLFKKIVFASLLLVGVVMIFQKI